MRFHLRRFRQLRDVESNGLKVLRFLGLGTRKTWLFLTLPIETWFSSSFVFLSGCRVSKTEDGSLEFEVVVLFLSNSWKFPNLSHIEDCEELQVTTESKKVPRIT